MSWLLGAVLVVSGFGFVIQLLDRGKNRREIRGISHARRAAASGRLDEASAILRELLGRSPNPRNVIPALELIEDLSSTAELEAPPELRALRQQIDEGRLLDLDAIQRLRSFLDRPWPSSELPPEEEAGETATQIARSEELEAAIARQPDDPAQYVVYADWLQGRGDVRGDLIALQQAIASDRADRIALRREEQRLFDRYESHLLPLEKKELGTNEIAVEWFCGYVRKAIFYSAEPRQLERFLSHPSALFLRELEIRDVAPDAEHDLGEALRILVRSPIRCLDALRIEPMDLQLSWTQLGGIDSLCSRFPALGSLRIGAGSMTFGELRFPALTKLVVATGSLKRENLSAIGRAEWPSLERLEIWFGDAGYGAECTADDLRPILAGDGLPKLAHLGLMNSELANELCGVLHQAAILRRIRTLDLSMGTLDDEGARSLAEHREAYAHLERIDLSDNFLGETGIQLVRELCPTVVTEPQKEEEDGLRYPSVGE